MNGEEGRPDIEAPDELGIPESVTIEYRKSDDYSLLPATGARGGVQLQNNMKIDFVNDYSADPDKETFEVEDDGGVGNRTEIEGGGYIVREKVVGISMRQDRALSVAAWIISSLLGPDVSEEDITDLVRKEYPERFIGRSEQD